MQSNHKFNDILHIFTSKRIIVGIVIQYTNIKDKNSFSSPVKRLYDLINVQAGPYTKVNSVR